MDNSSSNIQLAVVAMALNRLAQVLPERLVRVEVEDFGWGYDGGLTQARGIQAKKLGLNPLYVPLSGPTLFIVKKTERILFITFACLFRENLIPQEDQKGGLYRPLKEVADPDTFEMVVRASSKLSVHQALLGDVDL